VPDAIADVLLQGGTNRQRQRARSRVKRVISGKRYDFDDDIDVLSCAHGRSCGVGHE
jgi:hypothetical protein